MAIGKEHVEIIKNMWLEGKSSGEIVNYFCGLLTRGQILGKLYRMGIVGGKRAKVLRMQDHQVKKRVRRAREATMLKPPVRSDGLPWAKPAPMPTPSNASRRSFNGVSGPSYDLCDLNRLDCRFPLGDPGTKQFCYCAAPTYALSPYCWNHFVTAYQYPRRG